MEDKLDKLVQRKLRVRRKLKKEGYRLSLTRSNKYLFAQIIEMKTGKTVIGLSDKTFLDDEKKKLSKTQRAKIFGEKFAKEVIDKGIKEVVFDRGGYLYHGRIKAFAEGAREGGLKF